MEKTGKSAAAKPFAEMSDADWQERLTPEEFYVCRQKGTERPWSGKYLHFHGQGVYKCVCCGTELFHSEAKFDSGSGWPSFVSSIGNHVKLEGEGEGSMGLSGVEATCRTCGAHLGHLFLDGPPPSRKRY